MRYFNNQTKKAMEGNVDTDRVKEKTANICRLRVLYAAALSSIFLTACQGDNKVSNAPTPSEPSNFQQDSSSEVGGLIAYYDFEYSLSDSSGNSGDAIPIGLNTGDTENGSADFNGEDGSHALSVAAEFLGNSGLMLPNLIYTPSYSVSMWVKPDEGSSGPFFYAGSDKGWLVLDRKGLTVGGNTGQGPDGTWPITYTGPNYSVPAGEYSHVVFTVHHGEVDIYVNGIPAFNAGDFDGQDVFGGTSTPDDSSDDWIVDNDAFNDLFTGEDTIVALGVSAKTGAGEDEVKPFKGKIDNLRIFNEAIFFVNAIVLSNEVVNEGPGAEIDPVLSGEGIDLNWSFQRITVDSIGVAREIFQTGEMTNLTEDALLAGDATSYSDPDLEPDNNYRYLLTAATPQGQVFQTYSRYIRIPGVEPYVFIEALLNEESEHIDLTIGSDNIEASSIAAYNILRNTINDIESAEVIVKLVDADENDVTDNVIPTNYSDLSGGLAAGTPYYYWVEALDSEEAVIASSLTLPAASAKAAGVFSPLYSVEIQESEDGSVDGFCSVNASGAPDNAIVEVVNGGFTGPGYLNTVNADDQNIVWKVEIQVAGTYALVWRYANGGGSARNGSLAIDGELISGEVTLGDSGGWATWAETAQKQVFLEAGVHTFTLTGVTSSGLANIDFFKVIAPAEVNDETGPIPVACAGEQ